MRVHIVADSATKLTELRAMFDACDVVSTALLGDGNPGEHCDAVVIAADLRVSETILSLRACFSQTAKAQKRVFIVDRRSHLIDAQAYALGATRVVQAPANARELRLLIQPRDPFGADRGALDEAQEVAAGAASSLAAMFNGVMLGSAIDVAAMTSAGDRITESVAEFGLATWLTTVRRHHEGTYQHCLLVTGVVADFGLSLGMARSDLQRLSAAAMFHDIGKAAIPRAILDKPGKLDPEERAVIETHPVIGHDVLRAAGDVPPEILDGVRHHHEFLDGSGYPDALSGGSISDIVRILTISDIFAALIEDRRYKPCMPRQQAFAILQGMRGKLEVPLLAAFRDVALGR